MEWDWNWFFDLMPIATVGLAIYGINQWKRDQKWKRNYELAEEVLSLTYECRERFEWIRSNVGITGEGQSRKRAPDEDPKESEVLDDAYKFIERAIEVKEPFIRLETLKFRFMASFGKEKGLPLESLLQIRGTIVAHARALGQLRSRRNFDQLSPGQQEKNDREIRKHELVCYASPGRENQTTIQINQLIQQIEYICEPIISPPSNLSKLNMWVNRID